MVAGWRIKSEDEGLRLLCLARAHLHRSRCICHDTRSFVRSGHAAASFKVATPELVSPGTTKWNGIGGVAMSQTTQHALDHWGIRHLCQDIQRAQDAGYRYDAPLSRPDGKGAHFDE